MSVIVETQPLARFPAFQTRDLKAFRSYLSQSYCDHHVEQRQRHDPLEAQHNRLPLSLLSLNYLRYGAGVEMDIDPFGTFYMIELPQTGSVTLDLGGRGLVNTPGSAAIISPTMPVRSSWSPDCSQVMLKVSRRALEQQLSELLGRAMTQPLVFEPEIDLDQPEGASLARFCSFMLDHFGGEPVAAASRQVSGGLEQAFLTALLLNQPSNYSDLLRARSNSTSPRHVRRAVDYIGNHLRSEIAIDALVAVSGVSPRALYAGFERFVGMPPQALIKNMRLDRAREDLQRNDGSGTVAEVAMRWQFNHLGRFSADYRKRFGERPLDTLRH